MDLGLISISKLKPKSREICIQSKFSRKPFKSIQRCSEILGLIHSDISELNNIITRGGNKYFITFIDDYSKFSQVYLLKK